jgi:putative transposase
MFAIKRQLKLNNQERQKMAQHAGFAFLVYNWFVSFNIDAQRIPPITNSVAEPVGIDLGVTCFATISDGTEIKAPKPLKQAIVKLRKLQYHNRNKQFGDRRTGVRASNNAKKYFRKLSRFHKKVADKRKDFLHKTTTGICHSPEEKSSRVGSTPT